MMNHNLLGRITLFALVVLALPAALLCGARWLAMACAPGFSAACATACAAAPYAPWAAAYAMLALASFTGLRDGRRRARRAFLLMSSAKVNEKAAVGAPWDRRK